MLWYNLSLAALIASLVLVLAFSRRPRPWARMRPIVVLAVQISSILMGTWLLIRVAQLTSTELFSGASAHLIEGPALAQTIFVAAGRSAFLMLLATLWGTCAGLGAAYFVSYWRRGEIAVLGFLGTALWVIPTFLLAVVVQELQAQIFFLTGHSVTGGYGTFSPLQAFWAAMVLGIRPAAYVFRQSRLALEQEALSDHVRTAEAKGIRWAQVVSRHIFRPAAPTLTAGWIASFRLMIGSLPLIEFFFAYPGLGMQLVFAIGIANPDQSGTFQPDLAIGLVVAMAVILVSLEALAKLAQQLFDPRLVEVRTQMT